MEEFTKKHPPYGGIIHVLLLAIIAAAVGVGWLVRYTPSADSMYSILVNAHISLVLAGAALLIVELLVRIIFKRKSAISEFDISFRRTRTLLLAIVYILFTLMVVSGYGFVAFGPEPFRLWGVTLPIWRFDDVTLAVLAENLWGSPPQMFGWENVTLSQAAGASHTVISTILTTAVIAYVGVAVLSNLFQGLFGARRPTSELKEAALQLTNIDEGARASIVAKGLAQNVRFVGWMNLSLQLLLAFASGLLLQFARSGRAFGPSTPWLGASVSWAIYAFILLCFSIVFAYFYIRSSKKIAAYPKYYLNHRNILAFWFLGLGLVVGTFGIIASFLGVSVSIWMLIANRSCRSRRASPLRIQPTSSECSIFSS